MRPEIQLHHPAAQTHLPAHEQAARQHRATILGIAPTPPAPKPPTPPPGARKTWVYGIPPQPRP